MDWWKRLTAFLREVVAETKKVTWPSKAEVVSTTTVVIIASFIFGVYLYVCDFAFYKLVHAVFAAFHVFS